MFLSSPLLGTAVYKSKVPKDFYWLGVKAGANHATYSTVLQSDTRGFFGVFGEMPLGEPWSLQGELAWIDKGEANYLAASIFFKGRVNPEGWMFPYFMLGTSPAIKLGTSATPTVTSNIDWSLDVRAGIEFELELWMRLFAEFGFSWGIVNTSATTDFKSRGIYFLGGVAFGMFPPVEYR